MARIAEQNKVRELQRALYRAAKADPGRRFHALYDKVSRRDVLERVGRPVRANKGAAGIDRQTIADVEQYGASRLLDELTADLRDGRWRPLAARRAFIPKPGRGKLRPLSIPAVRDRVVGAAVKLVIEPVFEADFLPCSFGFRRRSSDRGTGSDRRLLKLLRTTLRAGVMQDGAVHRDVTGTPQGGVLRPFCATSIASSTWQWTERNRSAGALRG